MPPIELLQDHGLLLLAGATFLLGLGSAAVLVSRTPIQRQRLGELTLVALGVWGVLAVTPMARVDFFSSPPPIEDSPRPEASTEIAVASPIPVVVDPSPANSPPANSSSVDISGDGAGPLGTTVDPRSLIAEPAPNELVPIPLSPSPERGGIPDGWGVALYLAGSGLCLLYLLISALALTRLLRGSRRAPPEVIELAAPLGPTSRLRILVSPRSRRPFCLGVLRPTVVIPEDLCEASRRPHLCSVIAHELTHLRQRDARGMLLFAIALPFLYFHPLYWWLRRQVRRSAELVADDQAAAPAPSEYARRLLDLAHGQTTRFPVPLGAHTLLRSPSELSWRIEMLLQRTHALATRVPPARRLAHLAAATLVVAVMVLGVGVEPVPAQDARNDRTQKLMDERDALMARIADLESMVQVLQARIQELARRQPGTLGRFLEDPSMAESLSGDLDRSGGNAPAEDPGHRSQVPIGGSQVPIRLYRVKEGDTLQRIARKYLGDGTRWSELRALNPGLDPERIQPGTVIQVPGRDTGNPSPFAPPPEAVPAAPAPILDAPTLDLVTRAIDLDGERSIIERRIAYLDQLSAKGAVSRKEIEEDKVQLITVVKKLDLTHRLLHSEIQVSEASLQALERARAANPGRTDLDARVLRARLRIEALRSAM